MKKIYKNINHYFDINNNKGNFDIDFSVIKMIKWDFEKKLYSISKDFKFYKFDNIRNITEDFSPNKLKSIFSLNFDMPLLSKKESHFITFDNLNLDSPLLSMPTLMKKWNS